MKEPTQEQMDTLMTLARTFGTAIAYESIHHHTDMKKMLIPDGSGLPRVETCEPIKVLVHA